MLEQYSWPGNIRELSNAIEYAIENDSNLKIIKTMQRTARDDWRALKANGNGKRHEELAREVESAANEAKLNVELNDMLCSRKSKDARATSPRPTLDPSMSFKSFVAKSA